MSDKQQTFINPGTGEEIESSFFARIITLCDPLSSAINLSGGIFIGVPFGALIGLIIGLPSLDSEIILSFARSGAVVGFALIPILMKLGSLYSWLSADVSMIRNICVFSFETEIHDYVACWQHSRRKRFLQRKLLEIEWAEVPDRTLTRVESTTEPQPTDLSLTRSESQMTEDGGQIHLTEAVEEENRKKGLWQMVKARFTR